MLVEGERNALLQTCPITFDTDGVQVSDGEKAAEIDIVARNNK